MFMAGNSAVRVTAQDAGACGRRFSREPNRSFNMVHDSKQFSGHSRVLLVATIVICVVLVIITVTRATKVATTG